MTSARQVDAAVAGTYAEFSAGAGVYLSTGDSAQTDLPDQTVDVVLTDPPFFDNVHYSQLADFFYVWLKRMLDDPAAAASTTTRSIHEVQDTDAARFGDKLEAVWQECRRVLKPDGLLVFTYHHSRLEGWSALYQSVRHAGFQIVRAHPVKAEMAVAVPIQQSTEPISFDLIIVCRQATALRSNRGPFDLEAVLTDARREIEALHAGALTLTTGDVRVILMGAFWRDYPTCKTWRRSWSR